MHGTVSIVGMMRYGRPCTPTLAGYAFNGWVDAADLVNVTSDRDVYATWVFCPNGGSNSGLWRINNVSSWQPYRWGDMTSAGFGNQAGNGKNIGIAEAKFGSMTNNGYDGAIEFENWFFEVYESVTLTFFSGQGSSAGPVAVIEFRLDENGDIVWTCLIGSAKQLDSTGSEYRFEFDFEASGTSVAITDLVIINTKG